jgi:hypothetical protein
MTSTIVNVTRQLVSQKVEDIVKNPRSHYESAFANLYLRKKLIVRVLNQVPSQYQIAEESTPDSDHTPAFANRRDLERRIEQLVNKNILPVLQEENALQYFQAGSESSTPQEPSHWFG